MSGQRLFHRWNLQVPCICNWEGQAINATTINLSVGGACLTHPVVNPPEGADIVLTLLPQRQHAVIQAKVVHRGMQSGELPGVGRFGVRFYGSHQERSRILLPILTSFQIL